MPKYYCPECEKEINRNICPVCGTVAKPVDPASAAQAVQVAPLKDDFESKHSGDKPAAEEEKPLEKPAFVFKYLYLFLSIIPLLISTFIYDSVFGLIGLLIVLGFFYTWCILPEIIEYAIRKSREK